MRRTIALLATMLLSTTVFAQANAPAVVCNVKVVSDKVKDVSSLEAWKKSWILPGMTDKDKAIAIWE